MPVFQTQRSERIDLCMTPEMKRTLQHAAVIANKSLTEFLLDSGMTAAVDALTDRPVFLLDEQCWAEFMALLDAPPDEYPESRRSLARPPGCPPAWEA